MDFRPLILSPKAAPTMALSHSGVLLTRSSPNLSRNPSVTLKTPPYEPMSWPMQIMPSFFSMLIPNPSCMASINLNSRPSVVGGVGSGVPGAKRSSSSTSTFATMSGRSEDIFKPSKIAALCISCISASSSLLSPPDAFKCAVNRSTGSTSCHFSMSPSG